MTTPQPQFTDTAPPAAGPVCRFCGSMPAVEATLRGHQGLLVIMRFLKTKGPFCRSCGIAIHRKVTENSLWQGWWGIASMVINPITMLVNLPHRAKINKLPEPVPGAPGLPMNPGRPVYQRPAIAGVVIPALLLAAIVFGAGSDPEFANTGECVVNSGTQLHPDVSVVSCSDPKAQYRVVGRFDGTLDDSKCDAYPDTTAAYVVERRSTRYLLCLAELRG